MITLPTSRVPDPMTAPPLRWGVLGTGWIADRFFDAAHRHTQQRLAAVGSRTQAKADEFAARFEAPRAYDSYEALVADPDIDVVYVATPHSEHLANAKLAVEAGKHVLVEKAFTQTGAEARELLDAARAAGVAVMEAMWTRFIPHMDVLRQLLADGALGEIETVFADHGQWFTDDPKSRLFDPATAGGAMLDLGVYPVSFMHFALGTPGRALSLGTRAFTGVDRQISAVFDGFEAHLGANALITTTCKALTPTRAFIAGTKATVDIPTFFYGPQQFTLRTVDGETQLSDEPTLTDHAGLAYEAAHFASMVTEGRTESELLPWHETMAVMDTMEQLINALPRA
ncbi:Gfo/Idh/MocA family protein [Tessaracoccus sp. ZS01]|uniref:Gfo/Idh/MocA family protein n=1 Tax=Tessaracoccus sp. ZS01 TaxID=1906324 RepID=UPI0018EA303D|nr:Gfo/Idh/MocA family oxidoreductase [Tessaracoccus sp. ZS01]